MSNLFTELLAAKKLNKVSPDSPCDVCQKPAGYYSTVYYIHICTEECYEVFEKRVTDEINRFAVTKLKGKS